MRIRLLGPLLVRPPGGVDEGGIDQGSDEWISPGTPRERAVLALLAVRAGRAVHRDELFELLWGEEPPATANKTVQAYVSRLRRNAGVEIEYAASAYRLDVPSGDVDAGRFVDLVSTARSAGADDLDDAIRSLDAALALWRGRPFGELTDSVRGDAEAQALVEVRSEAAELRFELLTDRGDGASIIAELEQHCATEPLRERGWLCLMRALYLSGRQAEALRAFQRYRSLLADEVGVEPGPAAVELERRIAEQDPGLGPDIVAPVHASPPPQAVAAATPRSRTEVVCVGRDHELAELADWYRGTDETAPVCVIQGEPGIGKSTLMAAFVAANDRPLAIAGTGREGLGSGLGTIAELLVDLASQVDPASLRRHAGDDPMALSLLVPGLARIFGEPGDVSADLVTHRVAGAFVDLVHAMARSTPVLVAVDDLHWCSEGSLSVLRQLLRGAPDGLRLIATARSVDRGSDEAYRRFEPELERDVAVHRVALRGLEAEGVDRLLGADRPLAGSLAATVQRVSGGHPLFALAVLQDMDSSGRLIADDGFWTSDVEPGDVELPVALRSLVERRVGGLADLHDGAVRTMAAVAALGLDVDEDLVAEVLDLDLGGLLDLLDAAVGAELLDVRSPEGYRFKHELLRVGLAAPLTPRRLADLHRRAHDTLVSRPGSSDAAAAVRHGLAAGGAVPALTLAETARVAADHSAARYAPADEVEFRRVVVDRLSIGDADVDDRIRAEIDLGVAMVRDAADVTEQRAHVIGLCRAARRPMLFADAALRIGIDYSLGPVPQRVAQLREALAGLEALVESGELDAGHDLVIGVRAALAAQLWADGHEEERRSLMAEAIGATAGRRDLTRCRVLSAATWALPGVEPLDYQGDCAEELVALAGALDMPFEIATGLNTLAAVRFSSGDRAGGEAAAAQLRAALDQYKLPVLKIMNVSLQAGVNILHGDLDTAWELIHDAIELAEDDGVAAVGLGPVGRPIIELAADRGAVPRIPEHLFDFGDMLDTYAPYRMSKLYARVFLGDPTAAADVPVEIENIARFPRDIGHLFAANRLASVVDLADVDVDTTNIVDVLEQYDGLVDWSGSSSSGPAALWLAVLARRRSDHADARRWLTQAEELADALDAPLWRSRILRERALLADPGSTERIRFGGMSRSIATEAGADLIVRLLDRDGL